MTFWNWRECYHNNVDEATLTGETYPVEKASGVTLVFPFSPLGELFEFRPLTIPFFISLGAIMILYIVAAEMAKKLFYKKIKS